MAFMEPSSSGEFVPYVKFNAKEGRWFTKEDKPDADEFEVKDMTAIFDFDTVRTGWFLYPPGGAPIKNFDPSLSEALPKPDGDFKRGFQINLFSEKNLLGLREFAATAGVVRDAINELHTDWEAGKAQNPGKVPVVKCIGVTPITSKHGKNYRPEFSIVKWVDRPAALPGGSTATATPTPTASKPAEHAPPPAARAPEPVGADDEPEF